MARPSPEAAAADPPRGRARLMGDAILYAAAGLVSASQRHAATIVLGLGSQPMTIWTPRGTVQGELLVVRPLVRKRLLARQVPLVLIDLEPNHPQYRAFHGVNPWPGVATLDLARHAEFRHLAHAFYRGELHGGELDQAARRAIERVAGEFPLPAPLDLRVQQMMAVMDENPCCALEDVARAVGLSPHRASQLFSQALGLPLRRYSLSNKIRRAAQFMGSGRRLTDVALEAGFVDSAHFAKVWTQTYGAPPSHFFPAQRTAMDDQGLPDWIDWHLARRPPGLEPLPLPDRGPTAKIAALP
ncbi:MAG TPA: helix-turn-helix transcriptional regulator [Ideonella sp.]|uniref:helix-turn-helix transcriptional regulator n=1 Tax=Ideonella sp. TaxID=1929293 RepID=UPI002B816F89|nr:helix-turn-helix transcriptional regulator [Ideonella sp.]HSI49502.1 helix-turn-helix transcriptional regulator [Ideonella sp.]